MGGQIAGLPTYCTISDARYFPGTVALLNSLRLTNNDGERVVIDAGLTPGQRRRIAQHATLVDPPSRDGVSPIFLRTSIRALNPSGVLVFIDSDVIVTSSLAEVVQVAADGKLCAVPDLQQRFFPEWKRLLGLSADLQRRTYVNTGLLALDARRWSPILLRWEEICARVIALDPPGLNTLDNEAAARHPFAFPEQDALNAILMAEVPPDAVSLIDPAVAPTVHDLGRVRCVDAGRLRCRNGPQDLKLIHYINGPKPWEANGWITITDDVFVRLLPRLLLAEDVELRLEPAELPVWLRGGLRTQLLVPGLRVSTNTARLVARAIPRPVYERTFNRLKSRLRRPSAPAEVS